MTIKEIMNKNQLRKIYSMLDWIPDKTMVKLQHYAALGRKVNLKKPERFTDKIQWYKLNFQVPLMTKCADKYRVRDYLKGKGYPNIVPELYQVVDTYNQIRFDDLPNSFAIKSNNGSGTNIFVTNKNNINFNRVKKTVESWNKVNTLSIGREWAYKNIEPKIIIEELLKPEDKFQKKYGLNDYKILCFNGKPEYIWVDVKRATDHRRNFYDVDWNQLDIEYVVPSYEKNIQKPSKLKEMLEISEKISQDFPFVRVDFYFMNEEIIIGELTFYPDSGIGKFTPDSFDFHLGSLFNLPPVTTHAES